MEGNLDICFEIDFNGHIVVKTSVGKTFTVIIHTESFYYNLEGDIESIRKELWKVYDRIEARGSLDSTEIHQLIGFLNGIEIIFKLITSSRIEVIP